MKLPENIVSTTARLLESMWYGKDATLALLSKLLLPLSWLYRLGHQWRWRNVQPEKFSVSVIVVGNFTVGGSGKTPLIAHLTGQLQQHGIKVGILTHAHQARREIGEIHHHDTAKEVGDEAYLLKLKCPHAFVWCGRPRHHAIRAMVSACQNLSVILVDDGLQDPSFFRDVELVWADPSSFGNQQLIPSGPLRQPILDMEKPSAASTHRFLLAKSEDWEALQPQCFLPPPTIQTDGLYPLQALCKTPTPIIPWKHCHNMDKKRWVLVTAIARPQRVLTLLQSKNINASMVAFSDHYALSKQDIENVYSRYAHHTVVVTEKDAVKLIHSADKKIWVIDYRLTLATEAFETLLAALKKH